MKKRSLELILAIMLVFVTLLSGGLAQAYLAPDYNLFGPGDFVIGPGVLPDYLTAPNWAFSPILPKFVDPLPGLCIPKAGGPLDTPPGNNLCASTGMSDKNIPVAIPDVVTYPGSDYYVIELRQYSEMMHTNLGNPTTLRGYVQANYGTDTSACDVPVPATLPQPDNPCTTNTLAPAVQHFLGPVIVATKGRPVRVLFRNLIDPKLDGNLFLPVDDTIMGSGAYDINYNSQTLAMNPNVGDPPAPRVDSGMFSTNRATLHLHGGRSPWISDGTPHQWITPDIFNGTFDDTPEDIVYPQGVSVVNVPDMPAPAVGEQTFYWTNQQSSRMMFYHDHAWGITRLNVYAGEAAGYIIRDDVEKGLIDSGVIPAAEIPLVIMDKTFVDETTIAATDPTWNWGTGSVAGGNAGVVTWVTVTNGGSGYDPDPLNPPAVTIEEGANASASATAVISSVISSIDLTIPYVDLANPGSGGSGYVAPLVIIDDPNGSGASAEAAIDANGAITGFTITSGGWGYTAPVVTIADQNNENYTAASAAATVATTVSAVAITSGGSGYTNTIASPTVVTIDPPPAGTQATAVATVTDIRTPKTGDLWWPHVYMPAQNPFDITGVAPMGRWAYGPYFYPATNNQFQPIPNPYYSPNCDPLDDTTEGSWGGFCQAPEIPSTPNPSWGAEAFMDTPLVNGTAYPYLDLEPKHYRLRILNASHDRFMNLSLLVADPGNAKEVKMIDAALPLPAGCPASWPADGRAGGLPDCSTASNLLGPNWIMIGNEGGFLPMPVVIPPQVVTWNVNPSMFNVGNINGGSLILGPAERADVIVDFRAYAGKTLILYNDGAAPWPALNPQYDFYTNNPDGTASGAAPSTAAGFGPNTRTIMQIRICTPGVGGCEAALAAYDLPRLVDAFDPTDITLESGPGVFQQAQDPIIAAQGNMNPGADPLYYETFLGEGVYGVDYSAYSRAYGGLGGPLATFPTTYPNWGVSRINDSIIKLKTFNFNVNGDMILDLDGTPTTSVKSIAMKRKSIHDEMGATFDDYGRMRAALGLEKSNGGALQVNFVVQTYSSPVTEDLVPDGIQVWKITHNGVDTHPIHFHLFDVQVLNRVGWDGFIRLPDPTELGWKETVRISPLEDTIVAIKPVQPQLPFGLPESYRPLNPATPIGSTVELTQIDPVTGNPRVTENAFDNFAWEYVWHCHILSHEENDMMRAMKFHVVELAPLAPSWGTAAIISASQVDLTWNDNSATEFQFRIDRSVNGGGFTQLAIVPANSTAYSNNIGVSGGNTYRYKVTAVGASGEATTPTVATAALVPPAVPSGLTATAVSPVGINLGWTDVASESTYEIQRRAGGCNTNGWTQIGQVPFDTTAFQDSTGIPNATYGYQVRATNQFGSSNWSTCASATTLPPQVPANLIATAINPSQINVSWTDTPGELAYQLQRKVGAVCDANGWSSLPNPAANATGYNHTGLSPSTTYSYRIQAMYAGGATSAWSDCATVTTPAPQVPVGFTATAVGPTQINVSWTDAAGETAYHLQRKIGAVCDANGWSSLPNPAANATGYNNTGLAPSTTYSYRIRTVYANGAVSAWSGCATAITPAPPVPANLTATPVSATQINVSWTDTVGELAYLLQVKIGAVCDASGWSSLPNPAADATGYSHIGLTSATTYSYRIRALYPNGYTSAWSGCATGTTP